MAVMKLGVGWQANDSFVKAGNDALLMTPEEFKETYLWGIPMVDPRTGKEPSDDFFKQKIQSAQTEVENYFDLKLFRQKVVETKDFNRGEFNSFGYVKSTYTINDIYSLTGRLNELGIVKYPKPWLTIRRNNTMQPNRSVHIIPNGASSMTFSYYAVTYPNFFTFGGFSYIPNYWQIAYETGFQTIPRDLIEFTALLATARILPLIELIVAGGGATGNGSFAMASQSLSIDGLSQSGSKINGGNIFQQRLKSTTEQITASLPRLRNIYTGILFDVC